ncbi:MAG: GDSL-type esterase/lipase family protein [Bacteroides sp.]|nr:GDSL-type esterase/lipase family protein [Eubacterium sp.]MCM1418281.1 GDSL-type esterase/lipase family protein [Roseburia sp.]MCM1462384.1 GDSL-type esterase/lipase family protein [Bacteroides sp.]
MMKKRLLRAVCPVLIAGVLTGCAAGAPAENTADPAESEDPMTEVKIAAYTAESTAIKPLGRTFYEDGLLWCAYSGTGAEFIVKGTKCEIDIHGDAVSESDKNEGNYARVAVYVDGERVADEMMDAPEKTLTAFAGTEEREAVVTVVKLSETAMSCLAIREIRTDGEIRPTPDREYFIEFVGDSITCGYGVDDEDRDHHFSTATEDVTKAYAYRTAEKLGADYSMVSISGYGIISGYTDNGEKVTRQTVPPYYDKLGFSYGGFAEDKPQNYDWDFSGREPDVIVINLGTNDDSYCQNDSDKQAEYKAGYIELLKKIRGYNPNAKILCALGIMGDRLFPTVEATVAEYSAETGDMNLDVLHLTPQKESDGYAADWHPTSATHEKASDQAAEKLRYLLGIE